jgi:tetratricopeptide (TPR) repeat protein
LNTETYTSLLAEPQQMTQENLADLVEVIDVYPYFQSARALWLKGLKNAESFRYNEALKVTAAHTTNRDILFEFITSETFKQHKIAQQILINDAAIRELTIEISEDVTHTIQQEQAQESKKELQKAEAILNPNLFEKKIEDVEKMIAGASPNKKENLPAAEVLKSPSEILEIDKPLSFSTKDTYSFSEWLQLTSATPIERNTTKKEPSLSEIEQKEKERKFQLIEKFINEKPKIKPSQEKSVQKNLAEDFSKSSDSLMTETLAKVYLQQKKYKKAIQAYKILILKNPEKSGFFADQIRAVEKLINIEES